MRDSIAGDKPSRGFIVCRDASPRVQAAAKLIPALRLKRYRMSFSLEEIESVAADSSRGQATACPVRSLASRPGQARLEVAASRVVCPREVGHGRVRLVHVPRLALRIVRIHVSDPVSDRDEHSEARS